MTNSPNRCSAGSVELTAMELGVLELILEYGDGLDMSSTRFSGSIRAASRELARKGLISGSPKACSITSEGIKAIRPDETGSIT